MTILSKLAAVLSIVPVLAFASPALAASEGQIEGGNIYRVKNITKNTDFTDPVNADSCEVLQYKVRIHNPGPGFLSNVNVKVTLPNGQATKHTSTVTVSAVNADPQNTTDTAVVNLSSSQNLSYQSGSTQLLDTNNGVLSNLSDGIAGANGVNIGNVGVSINEIRFVQFQAKVSCPGPTEFTATATATATASASAEASASCPDGSASVSASASASATATATATATSNISQADADQKAKTLAQQKADQEAQSKAQSEAKANAEAKAKASVKCEQVTVTSTVTPAGKGPVALPNTGIGSVAGLFAGVSALAAGAHYMWGRRFGA